MVRLINKGERGRRVRVLFQLPVINVNTSVFCRVTTSDERGVVYSQTGIMKLCDRLSDLERIQVSPSNRTDSFHVFFS